MRMFFCQQSPSTAPVHPLWPAPHLGSNHHQKYLQSSSKIFAIIINNIIIEIFTIIVRNSCYNCEQYLQSYYTIFAVNGFEQSICSSFQGHSKDIFCVKDCLKYMQSFSKNMCNHCATSHRKHRSIAKKIERGLGNLPEEGCL